MLYERYDLVKIIKSDLFFYGKYSLILLVLIEIVSLLIVLTTYQTKQLIMDQEQIMLEKEALDIEYRHLIIEENVLGNNNRVEHIALNDLQMQYINPASENICIMP
ncbi:cell division protein FtsL [Blochmannia endosymbiont of Camponotus (Colobopsis) obliquus]|uniref:cell division protein FtsL n=1 Tax=Blochmannia endosymbiont of Camponotus (Colobopsis) obliquus TaxID=1505597 RepID=UPI00061A5BFE|nr:cell division protein FtsL [Blochmannia endosymbiont of Camponotus (Colobopsis) obliquus]AKC60310.1 cell division protein FtsL [Blochmannia endosymbiont of Camponotus (Colobopsis) obliquus]